MGREHHANTAPPKPAKHVHLLSPAESSSSMAATKSHIPSAHGKLHKRGSSASSVNNPKTSSDLSGYNFSRFDTPKATYEEPWEPARPAPTVSKPLKIKPYLRKLSVKDSNTLDLSRPAAENEGLAGLGIREYGASLSISDINFSPVNGRKGHNRSVSNTSQFSTSSSLQRPTAPYMPLRQTSRPYTPPQKSKSSPASIIGSDADEVDDIMSEEEMRYRQAMFDPTRRSGSISSTQAPALRVTTSGSSTRLGSYSQTSLSISSPATRSRGDTLKSIDTTTSPSSRTSLDKAFGFIRPGRDSPIDPASRAASIRAARQAYQEKEAAKELKAEREANKQADRENKKKYRQEERQRRKSDTAEKRSRSISHEKTPTSVAGKEYSNYAPAHTRSLPARVATIDPEKDVHAAPHITTRRAAKGRWLSFVTWFRTRLLRLGKRLHVA